MSDLRRLVDEGGTEAELALLRAAGKDRPPDDASRDRTLAVLAAASKVSAAVAGAKGAGALSKLASHAAVKWLAAIVLGGWVGMGTLAYLRHPSKAPPSSQVAISVPTPAREESSPAPVEPASVAPVQIPATPPSASTVPPVALPAPRVVASTPAAAPLPAAFPAGRTTLPEPETQTRGPAQTQPAPPPSSPAAAPSLPGVATAPALAATGAGASGPVDSRPPPTDGPSLSTEVALLDEARGALGAGDPKASIAALDRYAAAFPHGTFRQEATVLRIETLLQAGDRARAASLANAFLAADPNGPYAKRVRQMMK